MKLTKTPFFRGDKLRGLVGGASGSSGIVIIRYKLPPVGTVLLFR